MSRYDAIEDPLCYPGTQVLVNKAGIRDQDQLDQFEQLMFQTRAEEELPTGHLDYPHYKAIHHHFFQDIYDWAGNIRKIRTGKGGNWFCYPEYIDEQMHQLFEQLASEDHLVAVGNLAAFADRAAHYVAELNAIHPFREGNGRCQLVFLNMLLRHSGRELDENRLDPDSFMKAMVDSFHGDKQPLREAIVNMSILLQGPDG